MHGCAFGPHHPLSPPSGARAICTLRLYAHGVNGTDVHSMNMGSSTAFPQRSCLASTWLMARRRAGKLFNLLNGSAGLFAEHTLKVLTANRLEVLSQKNLPRMRCCASPCTFARRLFICH